ncbi:MAG: TetR/AcrR family transcriptional regulator [Clostridia bacterium]|nr:TetR/AcrR family transcriptional regulator [Clostridia bacterium]
MNKTKRKIFETSMKLFAEKGYDGTSIEEITSVVGVAKGTLYYHFSSKEEIFNFLVEEGMNLLKNSITIKTKKQEKYIDKLRAIILIQIKIIAKYKNFMSIVLSEIWGNSSRSKTCQEFLEDYLKIVKNIIVDGIQNNEIKKVDVEIVADEIFGIVCTVLYYTKNNKLDIEKVFKEIDKTIIKSLKV